MTPSPTRQTSPSASASAAGAVLYDGSVYDRQLRRCRVYAVADGEGGMEWRIVRGDEASGEREVERCFATYVDAMRWLE